MPAKVPKEKEAIDFNRNIITKEAAKNGARHKELHSEKNPI